MDDDWESAEFAKVLNEYDSSKNVQDGMKWIAATIAHKMRHLKLNLGTNIDDENLDIPSSQFNEYVSAGILTYPSSQFHRKEQQMIWQAKMGKWENVYCI